MEEQEALRAEYDARENDRLVAVRSGGPALLAWDKLRKRHDIAHPRMEAMLRSVSRHRAHVTELTVSLREKAASNTTDEASQLDMFAEIWQLVSATEILLSMQKRSRVAGASYYRLEKKTREAQEIARTTHQTPIRAAHEALKETRERMELLGMEIPEDRFSTWGQAQEEEMERKQKAEEGPGATTKPKKQPSGALAMTELIDELSTIEAAFPGTDKLWRALEGTTEGRPKRKAKKPSKPRRKFDFDGSYLHEPVEHESWDDPGPWTTTYDRTHAPLWTILETGAEM